MSKRCPNCHADIYGNRCPSCGHRLPYSWVCPDCGTEYFTLGNGPMTFCPACKAVKDKVEQDYWDNKRVGMRSIAGDIVQKILERS